MWVNLLRLCRTAEGLISAVLLSPVGLRCLFLSLISVPLQHESCNRTLPPLSLPPDHSGNTYFLPLAPPRPPAVRWRGAARRKCCATQRLVSSTEATIWRLPVSVYVPNGPQISYKHQRKPQTDGDPVSFPHFISVILQLKKQTFLRQYYTLQQRVLLTYLFHLFVKFFFGI